MRDVIRDLVIKAVTDNDKLTEVIEKLYIISENIQWETTGEVIDHISEYDSEQIVVGLGASGKAYTGSAMVSCGEIVKITCID